MTSNTPPDIRSVLEDTLELVRLGGYNDCILDNNLQTIGNYRLNVKAMTVDEALQAIREIATEVIRQTYSRLDAHGNEWVTKGDVTERLRAAFGEDTWTTSSGYSLISLAGYHGALGYVTASDTAHGCRSMTIRSVNND